MSRLDQPKIITTRVRDDIVKSLKMQSPHVTIGSFDRQNLFYSCKSFVQGNAFLTELVAEISTCVNKTESTIIYCTTVKNVEEVITFLQHYILLSFGTFIRLQGIHLKPVYKQIESKTYASFPKFFFICLISSELSLVAYPDLCSP